MTVAEAQLQLRNYFFVFIGERASADLVECRPWNLHTKRRTNASPFSARTGETTKKMTNSQLVKLTTTPPLSATSAR